MYIPIHVERIRHNFFFLEENAEWAEWTKNFFVDQTSAHQMEMQELDFHLHELIQRISIWQR